MTNRPKLALPQLLEHKTSLTLQQQWNLLRRFTEDLPVSTCKSVSSDFISTLADSILHAFLIMKRAELELLHSEASHASIASNCSIQLPHYENASPPASPGKETPAFLGRKIRPDMKIALCASNNREIGAEAFPSGDLHSPLSPLSPSFGPRRGEMLSGTVSRRRSAPQSPRMPQLEHEYERRTPVPSREEARRLLREDMYKRIQFEAAWKEIATHLDEYVGRFGLDENNDAGAKQKIAIWDLLVSYREEADDLAQSARAGREV